MWLSKWTDTQRLLLYGLFALPAITPTSLALYEILANYLLTFCITGKCHLRMKKSQKTYVFDLTSFATDKFRGSENKGAVLYLLGHIEESCQQRSAASVHCGHQQKTGKIKSLVDLVSFDKGAHTIWEFGLILQLHWFLAGKVCWCHLCKGVPEVSRFCAEMQKWGIWGPIRPKVQWKDEGELLELSQSSVC